MKRVVVAIVALLLFGACNPKQAWKRNAIESQEKVLMEQAKAGKVDTVAVTALLKEYEDYTTKYPADTIGATYLFKAADFYRYMHKPLRSIALCAKIYDEYPTVVKRPYALFLQGFIFENEVGNPTIAKSMYEKFLAQYPNHAIANDVRTTLSNLGKTPEQLIQEFEQNAKIDSLATVGK